MELIQGSETSANYNLTPGKYPEENIQYTYLVTIPTNENELKPETEKIITNANREFYALLAESWTLNKDMAKMSGYI